MAWTLRLRESMSRPRVLLIFLCFLAGQSAWSDCLLPIPARRQVRESCWVSVLTTDSWGRVEVCVPRAEWIQWLAMERPSCFPSPRDSSGKWSEVRPPLFDETTSEGRRHTIRRFTVQGPGAFMNRPAFGSRLSLSLGVVQALERRREALSSRLAPVDSQGWVRAWVLGESSRATTRESSEGGVPRSLFFLLGYVHLLTSAGVHLLMLAGVMEFVTARLFQKMNASAVRPVRSCLGVAQWALFFWIWALSGWRWGLLRPFLLIAIQQLSRGLGWRWEKGWPLVMSVSLESLISLCCGVESSWGRWHYFLAVGGGLFGSAGKTGWRAHLGMALGSWVALVPVQVAQDGWIALATPVLSLVTIPVVGYVLLPLILIFEAIPGVPFIREAIHEISAGLISASLPMARFTGSLWSVPSIQFAATVMILLLMRVWTRPKWRGRVLILLLGGISVFRSITLLHPPAPGLAVAAEVIQLDVGQGDAALVFWDQAGSKRAAAVDLGSATASDPARWIRSLAKRGVVELDSIVLTHWDEDHAGALADLLPWVRIGSVLAPPDPSGKGEGLRLALAERGIPILDRSSSCFPFPWRFVAHGRKANGVMAGVLVPLRSGGAYLNLGDAGFTRGASEKNISKLLADDWPELWKSSRKSHRSVLKLGHHGARTSSSQALLEEFVPARVVVSSGWQNRYGHPHSETLERVHQVGAQVLRTDQSGAVIIQ